MPREARAAPVGEVPLLGNQAPMPPQQVSGEMRMVHPIELMPEDFRR